MLEFCTICLNFILTFYLSIGMYGPLKTAKTDSWIAILLGSIIGYIFLSIFIYIFNYEPDLSLGKKITNLFGKRIGIFINIILIISAFILGINIIYDCSSFIISQFLSETPYLYIAIILILLAIYINTKGINIISRVALIVIFFSLILLLIAGLGLIPKVDIENFKPILSHGIKPPIISIFYFIAINIAPCFLLLAVPKSKIINNNKNKKYLYITYTIAAFLMLFIIVITLGNLGIYLANYYQYPEYMVLKRITFFNFINRIENFIISQWLFETFISLSFIIYYISNTISINYNKRILPLIIGIIILIISMFLFKNNTIYNTYTIKYTPYIRSIIIIIFLLISLAIFIKRKKSKT